MYWPYASLRDRCELLHVYRHACTGNRAPLLRSSIYEDTCKDTYKNMDTDGMDSLSSYLYTYKHRYDTREERKIASYTQPTSTPHGATLYERPLETVT